MRGWRAAVLLAVVAAWSLAPGARPIRAEPSDTRAQDLNALDLEDLMEIEVTSVSRRAQKVSEAAAAIYVISEEEIRRSGATTVPELLRRVPGLQVAQINANRWAVSARGFNGEFSNKLLVLQDGRSIYTPLFAGTLWYQRDLMLEDIERIEVIRGPGGTLWGANAVNGVINIISKSSEDTQGLLVAAHAGTPETFNGATRWGGRIGDDATFRMYGKLAKTEDSPAVGGGRAHDTWKRGRMGGRFDWQPTEADRVTVQGDFFQGAADVTVATGPGQPAIPDRVDAQGGNVVARYNHRFSETSDLQLQTWWDNVDFRQFVLGSRRNTFDVEFQHSFELLSRNQVIWGGGYRLNSDVIGNTPALSFTPPSRTDHLASFFVQDEIRVIDGLLNFIAGSKFEHNDYTGFEIQPSVRLLLTPHERHTFWGAISRAVRTPVRLDHDVSFTTLSQTITGNPTMHSEELVAYELGYRAQPIDGVTFDLATYLNDYDDLRSIEPLTATPPVMRADNGLSGLGWGAELVATWRISDVFHLTGSYAYAGVNLRAKPGFTARPIQGSTRSRTPAHQFSIRPHLSLPWRLQLDGALFWVDRLTDAAIPAHTRLDLRLAWQARDGLEIGVAGLNLIEEHQEFPDSDLTQAARVPRQVYGFVRWDFP